MTSLDVETEFKLISIMIIIIIRLCTLLQYSYTTYIIRRPSRRPYDSTFKHDRSEATFKHDRRTPAIVLKIVVGHVPYISIVSLEADKRLGLTGQFS